MFVNDYYLGIDGGQSSTTTLVGDAAGRVIGQGSAGPCNHVGGPAGEAKFRGAIGKSVGDACAAAKLNAGQVRFEAACMGFSGGAEDKAALLREMIRSERWQVTTDADIALTGATGGAPGIIVIAGTGSIALGRNAAGKRARAGGWGYVFGDEGGGFDLTRKALRAALAWEEGWGPATALHEKLLRAGGAGSANELMHWFYTERFPRPQIASYSKLVDEAAAEGDHAAQQILENGAKDLALIARAVHRELFSAGEGVKVAYIGGVFQSGLLRERFRMLAELEDAVEVIAPMYSPAAGALIEAYRLAEVKVALSQVPVVKT
jgi:N-acetylglucosamine kinase-like BadF-type ATPase